MNKNLSVEKREREVKKVLVVTLVLNLIVAGIKLWAGKEFHYLSLSTSGLESIFDGSANILALISLYFAFMPADDGHSFGHAKFETLGSFIIAILLVFSAFQVDIDLHRIWDEKEGHAQFGWIPVLSILFSMMVSFFVSYYEKRKARELGSVILEADANHTMGDFIISFGVLASILLSYFGYTKPDVFIGILIALYLLYLAYKIVRTNLPDLLDASPIIDKKILEEISSMDDVKDIHRFRARGNKSYMHVDFHLHLDPNLSLIEAHKIGHKAEGKLRLLLADYSKIIDILVHIEPSDESHKHLGES